MSNNEYGWGVYFDKWQWRYQLIGVGLVWLKYEKYVHFNLLNFELAIGKTSR